MFAAAPSNHLTRERRQVVWRLELTNKRRGALSSPSLADAVVSLAGSNQMREWLVLGYALKTGDGFGIDWGVRVCAQKLPDDSEVGV